MRTFEERLEEAKRTASPLWHKAFDFPCPRCGAKVGEHCKTIIDDIFKGTPMIVHHLARIDLVKEN